MAHHKSAKKRIRSNAVKRDRNKAYLSSVRTAIKSFRNAAEEGKKEGIDALFVTAQSLLHKAASKGMLHRNNASRKVARLSAVLKQVQSGTYKPTSNLKKKRKK